jgi:propane monooxygenase large subunit
MPTLTLNKITSQKGISVGEATKKIADLGWTPSYAQEAITFPTDYKFTKAPRDPMKQVLRSYFPMQEEKDNRVYGALDAALRGDMFRNVEPRWVEWMKLFLAIIPFPEISAARSMAMVARLAPGEELRTGFTMPMVDEFRHSTIQMNLKKWYMENYIDPAGFDITEEAFGKCYATTIGRQFGEGFITGDTMTAASVYLTVVAETAFTNTLFVAMPSEAARNGDYALPTVFLSVQSDESRHIGNGHSMLMAALKEPENHLLIERDLKYAFWQNHAIVDAAIGTFIEYGTTVRLTRYLDAVRARFPLAGDDALAFVAWEGGELSTAELPDYLDKLRAVRINMEFNGALCRGLKKARYREKATPDEELTLAEFIDADPARCAGGSALPRR